MNSDMRMDADKRFPLPPNREQEFETKRELVGLLPIEQPHPGAMVAGRAHREHYSRSILGFVDLLARHCLCQLRGVRTGKCHNNCCVIALFRGGCRAGSL